MGLVTALLLPPHARRAMVVCMDPFDWLARPACILEVITRYRASFCWLRPTLRSPHLTKVAPPTRVRSTFPACAGFIDCSEPCRADTLDAFAAAFARRTACGAWRHRHLLRNGRDGVRGDPVASGRTTRLRVPSTGRLCRSMPWPCRGRGPGRPAPSVWSRAGGRSRGTSVRICRAAPAPAPALGDEPGRPPPDPSAPSGRDCRVGEIVSSPAVRPLPATTRNPEGRRRRASTGGWYRTGDLGFVHEG